MESPSTGIRLTYGVHEQMVAAVGMTIAQVREIYHQVMNIPAEARAVVNGKKVNDDHTLKAGEEVEFIKEAGIKGSGERPSITVNWLAVIIVLLVIGLVFSR